MEAARRVLLVTNPGNPVAVTALADAKSALQAVGFDVVESVDLRHDAFGDQRAVERDLAEVQGCELVVVLGGDGTILRAAELTHGTDIPILGINLGHVGFLAEAERDNLTEAVTRIAARDYIVEKRTVAEVSVYFPGAKEPLTGWALNEATIEKSSRERMVEVGIEVDDQPLESFGCDGVIISTATGSTAHAFSAGGPVLWPNVEGILLVPLAAHALFARPLVIGPTSSYRVTILPRSARPGVLTCDGRRSIWLPRGAQVVVRVGQHPLKFARLSTAPFTNRLVSKFALPTMGWRESASQAAMAKYTELDDSTRSATEPDAVPDQGSSWA